MNLSKRTKQYLAVALAAAGLWGLAVEADAAKQVARIGLLVTTESRCGNVPFREGLRELGYVEGKNIVIECRHSGGRDADIDAAAAALVRAKPDVIVALGHAPSEGAHRATRDIPVVATVSGDPVATGLVESLARPGGNLTGVTYYATELYAKRLEFLKAMVPNLKRVGLLVQPSASKGLTDSYLRACRTAAKELGLDLVQIEADNRDEIERAFETAVKEKVQALHVLGYLLYANEGQLIADLASFQRLPVIHFESNYAAYGGLMGYGPDYAWLHHRTAYYIDRILKGAKPGELPVEMPSRLHLGINLTTARELGLKVPQSLLMRADKVIE
ncbi:MAG: ABC transporter substrate-binding protein [Gammaproteobacteria bacterium]|nr:ABC transporter substrate-binding protein [Gammaproteobacteria bacterium]